MAYIIQQDPPVNLFDAVMASKDKKKDDGTALALFIELGTWLDPKLSEDDKRIVLSLIKQRVIR